MTYFDGQPTSKTHGGAAKFEACSLLRAVAYPGRMNCGSLESVGTVNSDGADT